MKIGGKKPVGPNTIEIFIPRGENEGYLFKAQAVLDYSDFEKLCVMPVPPRIRRPGDVVDYPDPTDSKYKVEVAEFSRKRTCWMILKSLEATPELEWDTVVANDSNSWGNYAIDLTNAGFSEVEIGRIITGVLQANCLDENMINEGRKRFLASRPVVAQENQ